MRGSELARVSLSAQRRRQTDMRTYDIIQIGPHFGKEMNFFLHFFAV